MGISFPKRPQRSTFGPKLVNNYPVENPASEVPDTALNGMFSTVAGCALIQPRASCVAQYISGSFSIQHQAEAWNQEGDQVHPVLARLGAGLYSYTFAATYLDEDGVATPTDLRGARVTSHGVANGSSVPEAYAWIHPLDPLQVLLRVGTRVVATGVLTNADEPFWLEVL